ncbi:MAG: hypothetical protein D4R45_04400 [Planctomycetaceae bacterium]|nr:MAG: hypothetical protein D4R45_04400 [Planctomycetaceae bacterium]
MVYTFTSLVPHTTIDFLRFDRHVWRTSDPELARQARAHPLIGKDFFDANPEESLPKKKVQNPVKNEDRLKRMSLMKLKEVCIINALLPDGNKEVLIERLSTLKEIKWEIKRSTTPILEMSQIAYVKKKRMQRRKTKTIGR